MKIELNSGIPIYLQIVTEVKNAAIYGRYRHGDRIPPVRELAISLRVNPNTVAKAYRILQEEGWLESRPGGGNFIVFQAEAEAEKRREDVIRQELDAVINKAGSLGVSPARLAAIMAELLNKEGENAAN